MTIEIRITTSHKPETCFRCVQLGLPEFGIPISEQHAVMVVGREVRGIACMDCYERLVAEIGEMDSQSPFGE